MADNHQTVETPPPPQGDTTIITPRAEEAQLPVTVDPTDKAAIEAKDRMAKTQGFWNRLSPDKEDAKPDKAEAQPSKPPKKDEKTEAVAPVPEPEKTKPKGRKKEAEIDPVELARETGREIGREIAKAQSGNVPRGTFTPEVNTEVELPEEFRPDVAVFEEMSRLDPKRYGSIKKELSRYAQAESDYIAKWEAEHDGETYDGDADEHNAFYAKIRPNYDQKDFKLAEKSLLKQELRKEVTEDLRSREAESEKRKELATKIQPEVERDMFNTLAEMIKEVDPHNAGLSKDWASIQTLDEKNPLLADVMVAVHNETKPIVTATLRLFRSVEAPDTNNPAHRRVFDLISKAEDGISRLPVKDRYDDDGRLFATQEDYSRMSQSDKSRHWYVGEREALAIIRGQAIARTKSIYDQENQKMARYSKRQTATQSQNPPSERRTETPPQPRPDNGSPSVSGRGTLPGDNQGGSNKPSNGRDLFFGRHLGA